MKRNLAAEAVEVIAFLTILIAVATVAYHAAEAVARALF